MGIDRVGINRVGIERVGIDRVELIWWELIGLELSVSRKAQTKNAKNYLNIFVLDCCYNWLEVNLVGVNQLLPNKP